MPIVWLKLPNNNESEEDRPKECVHCGSQVLQRWGKVSKPVRDVKYKLEYVYRYRCAECERTFRHYPKGVDRSEHSLRVRQVAGLAWAMGLSTREVVNIFSDLGLALSHTSVWREGQRIAELIQESEPSKNGKKYAIDRSYIHRVRTKIGVVVALEVADGAAAVLGTLDEFNPKLVKSWMESIIQGVDIDVSVLDTGTLDHYHMGKLPGASLTESSIAI